jgi:hypothetical protein
MYSNKAASVCLRVCHMLRQINSALRVLKKVSTTALKLLYLSSGRGRRFWRTNMSIYFTYDVAFQASNNLTFGFSIPGSFTNVGNRGFVISHPHNGDTVERGVRLPVAASVQSEPVCFATGGWYWANATEFRERCF